MSLGQKSAQVLLVGPKDSTLNKQKDRQRLGLWSGTSNEKTTRKRGNLGRVLLILPSLVPYLIKLKSIKTRQNFTLLKYVGGLTVYKGEGG